MDMILKRISMKIPEFCMSHWLFRIPLAIIFINRACLNSRLLRKMQKLMNYPTSFGGSCLTENLARV